VNATAQEPLPALEAKALAKTYRGLFGGRQTALRGLDLRVPRGTAFGLIGPNGAGKTTFIKLLLGVVRPTAGSVGVFGGDPEDPRTRSRIGYLPERLHLPDALKPGQFLASCARFKRLPRIEEEVRKQLTRVGLAPDAHRKIGGFSKGMRQRLGLAAALLGGPELLVLDEPTDGIDPIGRMEVRRILVEERARGTTLFLNSHLLSETERVCDRIGILAEGRLVREGRLEDLCGAGTRWRLRFAAGFEPERLREAGLVPDPDGTSWNLEAADERELNGRLDELRTMGALLIGLAPDERDLETVLADALRRPA